jgi:hypothetical protein
MWGRRWCLKRRNMWVHLINIKRPEFGTFSHLYLDLLDDEEKFHGFFRMNILQFYHLSQLVGEELRKRNLSYMWAISPEELIAIFLGTCYKNLYDTERYTGYNLSYPFS